MDEKKNQHMHNKLSGPFAENSSLVILRHCRRRRRRRRLRRRRCRTDGLGWDWVAMRCDSFAFAFAFEAHGCEVSCSRGFCAGRSY